jgi:hypothetical protein
MVVSIALITGLMLGQSLPSGRAEDKEDTVPGVSALLRIGRPQPTLPSETSLKMSDSEFAAYQRTQAALIKSRSVLEHAIEEPRVARLETIKQQPDPVAWVQKNLKVERLEGTELIRLSFTGKGTADLANLVNAVAEAYVRESHADERSRRLERLARLQSALEKYKHFLHNERAEYRAWVADVKSFREPGQLKQEIAALSKELMRVRIAKIEAQAKLDREAARTGADEAAHKSRIEKLKEEVALLQAHEELLGKELGRTLENLLELELRSERTEDGDQIVKRLRSEITTLEIGMDAPSQIAVVDRAAAR